jgi:hypothetical protein
MTDYLVTVATETWELALDTRDPDPSGARQLVEPLLAQWATDTLPPLAAPSTVQLMIYDDGTDPAGWLPLEYGLAISVFVTTDPGDYPTLLLPFKGRVADVSAVNHPRGGVVFRVVCADRLADLASTSAPKTIRGDARGYSPAGTAVGVELAYIQLADHAEIGFDYGDNLTMPTWELVDGDAAKTNTLETLNRYMTHDIRDDGSFRWLAPVVDTGTVDPDPAPNYAAVPYDPHGNVELANLLLLHWTGSIWTLIVNPDYYH